ncbi:MAG: hypothetical protein JXR62_07615, partial [Bacilli bacterium]|nr:hypothetical protein [Bacilli bacterium]
NRLAEAKKKLADLNDVIDHSEKTTSFSNTDQLDDLIGLKNKIFNARQEIRFFESKQSPMQLDTLQEIYQSLISSVDILNSYEENYRDNLQKNNEDLYNTQFKITSDVVLLMDELFEHKIKKVQDDLAKLENIYQNINQLESDFYHFVDQNITQFSELQETSSSYFTDVDDDLFINEKIQAEYDDIIRELNVSAQVITSEYEEQKASILKSFEDYVREISKDQKVKNNDVLEQERIQEEEFKEKLKAIKLKIISAEKKNDYSLVAKLLKQYDNLEKTGVNTKFSDQATKETAELIEKAKMTTSAQILEVEKDYATSMNRVNHNIALEKIKLDEAKILYKIKSDYKGLEDDLLLNEERVMKLKEFVDMKVIIGSRVLDFKLQLRLAELQIMKENELLELNLIKEYKEFLVQLKQVENTHFIQLKENINNYVLIKAEQEHQSNKSILDLQYNLDLVKIDNEITIKRNETFIQNEELSAKAIEEISYQELLIEIAKKEHSLHLTKIKESTDDDSTASTKIIDIVEEAPVVDDEVIAETLENQMTFATEQIEVAKTDFDKRAKSIQQTLAQELESANAKIAIYRQKYDDEKLLIKNELAEKTEDLNFKLLLFTDEKENQEIKQQIDSLTSSYQVKIDEVDKIQSQDENIALYQQMITDATTRARTAIKEAQDLKEQTIKSFEKLHEQAKEKLVLMKETVLAKDESIPSEPVRNETEQAIHEANVLLQKQLEESERIINEKKAYLKQLASDAYTANVLRELISKKEQIHKSYQEQLDLINQNKTQELDRIHQTTDTIARDKQQELETLRNTLFTNISYRNSDDIEKDYDLLDIKENDLYNKHIAELESYKKEFLVRIENTANQVKAMINAAILPYKRYIDYASKGLVATKKDVAIEYEKLLKQSINELNNRYKRDSLI